jgi:CheY-like chemotaxis protein
MASPEEPSPTKPLALIVEEDEPVRRALARSLEAMGFAVATTESGEQAVERLRQGDRFALVVSDVEMRGLDGPTFLEAARSIWSEIDGVLVFLTGGPKAFDTAGNDREVPWFAKPPDATFYDHARSVLERRRRGRRQSLGPASNDDDERPRRIRFVKFRCRYCWRTIEHLGHDSAIECAHCGKMNQIPSELM